MTPFALYYRPGDDMFVILDGGTPIASTSATDMLGRKTPDPDALKAGILRFLDFRDWQTKSCGLVLWPGTAESAMATAPRL